MPLRVIKIQLGTTDGKRFTENPTRFEKCVQSVAARGGAYDPKAVCAAAGRKKYGKRKFAAMAAAGRRRAAKNAKSLQIGQKVYVTYDGQDMDAVYIGKRDGRWWVRTHGGAGRAIGMAKRRDIRTEPLRGRR